MTRRRSEAASKRALEDLEAHIITTEQWRPVVGFEGRYEVSSGGRIRSLLLRGRGFTRLRLEPYVLKPRLRRTGYLEVDLFGTSRCWCLVHRVVLEAFVGPCPVGQEAAHLNGRRTDNRPENLMWATRKENEAHKQIHGTKLYGERIANHRLTATQVAEIRQRHAAGERQTALAALMGVSRQVVWHIIHGRTWGHVQSWVPA